MTAADVNVPELVARVVLATEWEDPRGIHPPMRHEAQSHYAYWCPLCRPDLDDNAERIARVALAALRSPDVVAGIAGVLRDADDEWRRLLADAPQGHPPTRSEWQARAVVDWLAGGGV